MKKFLIASVIFCTFGTGRAFAAACGSNQITHPKTGDCYDVSFEITPSGGVTDTFEFYWGGGYDSQHLVDWGESDLVEILVGNPEDPVLYSHRYKSLPTAVRFARVTTGFGYYEWQPVVNFQDSVFIGGISGSLSALFPQVPKPKEGESVPSFDQTFSNTIYMASNGTTIIPTELFADYTSVRDRMFAATFAGAGEKHTMTGYIPASAFAGLIANDEPSAVDLMTGMFSYTDVSNSCPTGTYDKQSSYSSLYLNNVPLCAVEQSTGGGVDLKDIVGQRSGYYCYLDSSQATAGPCKGNSDKNFPMNSGAYTWTAMMYDTKAAQDVPFAGLSVATSSKNDYSLGYIPDSEDQALLDTAYGSSSMGSYCFCKLTSPVESPWVTFEKRLKSMDRYDCAATCGMDMDAYIVAGDSGIDTVVGAMMSSASQSSGGGGSCDPDEIDVTGDGTNCQTAHFGVTLSRSRSFLFQLGAKGTFYVDCGNGGTLEQSGTTTGSTVSGKTITRTDVSAETTYTCTWGSSAKQTVRFGGTATNYSDNRRISTIKFDSISSSEISSVSGNMSAMFPYISGNAANGAQPRFYQTFRGATNLTNIDENLFANYTTGANNMFYGTFSGCTGLTSIPAGLFGGVTTGEESMFSSTFDGCTGLTSIPAGLFSSITTGANAMFSGTFYGCTGLTSIPAGLFGGITTGAQSMFSSTFNGCTNISGYIPKSTFAGLVTAGSPTATNMWTNVFSNTNLSSECPKGTAVIDTTYQGTTSGTQWGDYAMCEELMCTPGKYIDVHVCSTCPENSYCTGGSAAVVSCPNGTYSPTGASDAGQCGRILNIGDDVVYLRSTKATSPALHIDTDHDGIADFFGNMTTADVVMHAGSERKFKVKRGNITYSVYDDTVTVP